MESIAVGIIGAGTISRNHAAPLSELGHEVAAVADIDEDALATFASEYESSSTYEDYERMLNEEDLNAVLVAVPNALHADCAIAALKHDVNVLVEKPLADSLENARRIADAEAESDANVMVGFKKAFEDSTDIVTDIIEADEMGEVYEVNIEMVRQRSIPQIGSWFTRKDVSGGGPVVDLGPHMLHLALYLLDFPTVETVSASTGAHFGPDEDYSYMSMWGGEPTADRTFDVEDHARALIRTADGATIHTNLTWATNREGFEQVQVLGNDAGATFDPHESEVFLHSTDHDSLTSTSYERAGGDEFRRQWEYFAEVITGERDHTMNTVEQGLAVQRLIESIYESAKRDREVTVAPDERQTMSQD